MKKKRIAAILFAAGAVMGICSCGEQGTPVPQESNKTEIPVTASNTETVKGEDVFKKTCLACHQANGEGIPNTFPPLAKSDFLADKKKAIEQVIKGKSGELTVNGVTYNNTMPPQNLSDEEIAAVLSYVYSNFGNSGSTVTVDEVKSIRAQAQ